MARLIYEVTWYPFLAPISPTDPFTTLELENPYSTFLYTMEFADLLILRL